MKRVVISDTSCLIVLSKIGYLHLLQSLFGEVLITEEVRNEFGETLLKTTSIEKNQKSLLITKNQKIRFN